MNNPDIIATSAIIRNGQVVLSLIDGSTHTFPTHYYPRLATASGKQLSAIKLRVGGRALRWDNLDEDIWVADALLGRYPASLAPV